ncbi:MAG TPA: hypothetical protein VHZ51_25195 [Ktedonobacteraceae bacterium]|nr:hypothetical protein [Ktedonobacteraceae bacterium]
MARNAATTAAEETLARCVLSRSLGALHVFCSTAHCVFIKTARRPPPSDAAARWPGSLTRLAMFVRGRRPGVFHLICSWIRPAGD